jgi:hypothetical protein
MRGKLQLRVRIEQHLGSAWAPWLIFGVTLLFTLPTLAIGFFLDDHALRASLRGTWPGATMPAWDLYRFIGGDAAQNRAAMAVGGMPWWSAPELRLHLVRPLSSLLFSADYRIFGDWAVGYHVHTLAWYVALLAAVGRLFTLLFSRATASLALLIFAWSPAHFHPYAWVSSRHLLVAALPVVLGLTALVRKARFGNIACAVGLALGLLGSEAALSLLGFLVGYAALGTGDRRARVLATLPSFGVALIYLLLYRAMGGGAAQSDAYVDPLHAPLDFSLRALSLLPMLLGNALLSIPADMSMVASPWLLVAIGILAAFAAWRVALRLVPSLAPDERQHLPWLVLGAVVALIPTLAGFPGARVLLLPNLGFAPLLAILIQRGTTERGLARAFGYVLLVVHVLLAPLVILGNTARTYDLARTVEGIARDAEIGPNRPRAFVVGVSDPLVTMYAGAALAADSPERLRCWSVLSASKQAHRLERRGSHELLLIAERMPMVQGPFETLYRARSVPFRVGDTSISCGATFTVMAVEGGSPTSVSIRFDRPLEDPSIRILVWTGKRLSALTPPTPSSTQLVPWSPGPFILL